LHKDPLICPVCGQGRIIEGRQAFGCNRWRQGCDYRVAKEAHGRVLTEAELRALVARHRSQGQPSAD
jgi:DNA topoisomerase-3